MSELMDKHAVFLTVVLRAQDNDTSERVQQARRHIADCTICPKRLEVGVELLRNLYWMQQQSI